MNPYGCYLRSPLLKGLRLHLIDIVGAFLNAKPQGENYLEIPEGFETHTTQSLESTQSSEWSLTCTAQWTVQTTGRDSSMETFNELGHRRSRADSCMRIQYTADGGYSISATYTDDISSASSTESAESQTVNEIAHKFEITDHWKAHCRAWDGIVHHPNGDISIHQKSLIVKALTEYNMVDCKPKYTPLPPMLNSQIHNLCLSLKPTNFI